MVTWLPWLAWSTWLCCWPCGYARPNYALLCTLFTSLTRAERVFMTAPFFVPPDVHESTHGPILMPIMTCDRGRNRAILHISGETGKQHGRITAGCQHTQVHLLRPGVPSWAPTTMRGRVDAHRESEMPTGCNTRTLLCVSQCSANPTVFTNKHCCPTPPTCKIVSSRHNSKRILHLSRVNSVLPCNEHSSLILTFPKRDFPSSTSSRSNSHE